VKAKSVAKAREIAAGVYCFKVRTSNVYFVRSGPSWVLIDAGWGDCGRAIREAAESVFGPVRPAAILLTHAHPDHYGAAAELARGWGLPVYVHAADLPMLLGDPLADEDLDPIGRVYNAVLRLLPRRVRERTSSSKFKDVACVLPESGAAVPGLADWQCVPTPGHTPGHVVFFRPSDGVVIAGDAALTAAFAGLMPRRQELSRPMRMVSSNWRRTMESVATLAALEPRVLASGHGVPMAGPALARELRAFADRCSRSVARRRA
jgi:glyoxylase-like metal-dependent hydrolase (beta-lactamase superfamily II)